MSDYEKFKRIYNEIDKLLEMCVTSSDAEFKVWYSKVSWFLINKFGQESYEYKDFNSLHFSLMICTSDTQKYEFIDACAKDLKTTKKIFEEYLNEMKEDKEVITGNNTDKKNYNEVFIVHGHDSELKVSVARLLEKQGIKPIILHEQPNQGHTIIEKIESYSDVGAAIVLFTEDDLGHSKEEITERTRARQNVVFEAGYFMAKLRRENIIIIAAPNIELPGDLSGIVYTDRANWELEILKELKAIGFAIDVNRLI